MNFPTNGRILFICGTYFYSGQVVETKQDSLLLKDAVLVLDTGPMKAKHWNEAEYLGNWYIATSKIESWGYCEKTIKPDETNKPAEEV